MACGAGQANDGVQLTGYSLDQFYDCIVCFCEVMSVQGDEEADNAAHFYQQEENRSGPVAWPRQRRQATRYMLHAAACMIGPLYLSIPHANGKTGAYFIPDGRAEHRQPTAVDLTHHDRPAKNRPSDSQASTAATQTEKQARAAQREAKQAAERGAGCEWRWDHDHSAEGMCCLVCRDHHACCPPADHTPHHFGTWDALRAHALEVHPTRMHCPYCGVKVECPQDEPASLMEHWCATGCINDAHRAHVAATKTDPNARTPWAALRKNREHASFSAMSQAQMDEMSEMTSDPSPHVDEGGPMWGGRPYNASGKAGIPVDAILYGNAVTERAIRLAHAHAMRGKRAGGMMADTDEGTAKRQRDANRGSDSRPVSSDFFDDDAGGEASIINDGNAVTLSNLLKCINITWVSKYMSGYNGLGAWRDGSLSGGRIKIQ